MLAVQATCLAAHGQGFLKGLGEKASRAGQELIIRKGAKKIENAIDGPVPTKNKSSAGEMREVKLGEEKKVTEITAYSKFDFIPGENTLLFDNFEQDAMGEFPLKWFTNGSGEIVSLEGQQGKWLQINSGSMLSPTLKLPENFTVEFDLFVNLDLKSSAVFPGFHFELFDRGDRAKRLDVYNYTLKNALFFSNSFDRDKVVAALDSRENNNQKLKSDKVFLAGFQSNYRSAVHVALSIQKERLRLWYGQIKVLDLPTAVANPANFNQMLFNGPKTREGYPAFYISNLRIASGSPDMRSKLLDSGRFVTNGIQFDVNSDKIKPASYGLIKEIANAINESPTMKIKIVGHTDNDGNVESNLSLSFKRAESVKRILVDSYNVKEAMLSTDGKGSNEPLSSNATAIGKAENRRVEFIKI